MPTETKHECKISNLTVCNKPSDSPDGECVSFTVRCRICGRKFEEVYGRNDGLWDPDKKQYVFLENDAIIRGDHEAMQTEYSVAKSVK